MCCEICPNFAKCEEEGNVTDTCCATCSDYKSCHDKAGGEGKESDELEEDLY